MKISTLSLRKYALIIGILLSTTFVFSQTADFNVQHLQSDIGNSGGTNTSFTAVSSLNNAFALPNNNRKVTAGPSSSSSNFNGDDLAGASVLTGTNTLSFYREAASTTSTTRFNTSIWEYVGPSGGDNEMIIRGRYAVTLNGGTNSTTQALSGIVNANKCIPFITGIMNDAASQDSDSGTAIAYLESAATLRVQKGSNANSVTIYITVVEFTGSNWTVLHGDSGNASADTGTITLTNNSDATGASSNVSSWNNAIIFGQHRGDMTTSGTNDAIADNWPVFEPGNNNQRVDWTFNGNHDSNATNGNRHFVHVLSNSGMNVTRFQDTSNSAGATNINISSAGLSSINEALIVGSSISSGTGQAYARGWRNYYLNSITEAAHWSHRSGNNMNHEIQIVDLAGLTTSSSCATTVNSFPYTEGFESGLGNWTQVAGDDDEDWTREEGGTPSGNTGPSGPNEGTYYMFTEASYGNDGKSFYLDSPCFDLTSETAAIFSFYYHMYGNNMGDLFVDISTNSGLTYPTTLWSQLGEDQANHNEAWELVNIDLTSYIGQTINLRFRGETGNGYASDMAIDNISLITSINPEINILGNGIGIVDGDTTPAVVDDTDFGSVIVTGSTNTNVFTIENIGIHALSVGAITISGANAADFSVTSSPSSLVAASSSTTFEITFDPSATGLRTASVSIVNGDSDENPYNFDIQGNGSVATYSNVTVNVDWPSWSGENRVEVYDPSGTLITTIDDGYDGSNGSYSTSVDLGCLIDLNNYYVILYDSYGDGWDGADNITVTSGGSAVINQNGNGADPSGETVYFNVSGGGSAEIDVTGNGTSITDGDTTPDVADNTDFGSVNTTGGTSVNAFVIDNIGCSVLNLTGSGPTYVSISGAHAADFSVTANPSTPIGAGSGTSFDITFDPSAAGLRTATVSIANNDSDENPYNFDIQGTGLVPGPEIDVLGNAISIVDGDTTPDVADDTDFGAIAITGSTNPNTFTIENNGTAALSIGAITISGAHAADFTVTSSPSSSVAASGSTTFVITFDPSATGLRTASVSIVNDDSDENPYNFNIQGSGTSAGVCLTTVSSYPYEESFETGFGSWRQGINTASLEDDFDWSRTTGSTPTGSTGPNGAQDGNYYIFTEANGNNNSDAILFSPCFDLTSASNPRFTFFYHMYGSGMGDLTVELSTDNGLTYPNVVYTNSGQTHGSTNSSFTPISVDLSAYIGQTIRLRIIGEINGNNTSDMAIDMVTLEDKPTPTVAPGGVTADLALWLKADDGLSHTSGQSVTSWIDQGLGSNARVNHPNQAPTYYDNTTKNVNFNPVIEFNNSYTALNLDGDYSHDSTTTQFLSGDYGFFTQEIFMVLIPDDTPINNSFGFMDVFCSDAQLEAQATDGTGIGFGNYTSRVNGEIIVYAHDSYDNSPGDGYAVAEIGTGSSYDNVGIINTRNNASDTSQQLFYNANNIETTQNDIAEYMNTNDSRWWLGRSEGWEASLNARVAEVITYSARKDDATMTQERNRIQSYLGIKYGITLGVNGTSQDYVNSDGTVIWDQSADSGIYNYDIAGIGRDDASELYQKQSRSVNNASDGTGRTEGILTFGLTDIYDTNRLNQSNNATTLNDKEFLVWGNNGADLNLAATTVTVNMSAGISPALTTDVSFTAMQRVWKVVETGGDVPSMKVRIPQNAIRNIVPPGDYYMFISSTGVFDPTADYRIMRPDGYGNLETDYDFDGTNYITFGYAPRVVVERSVYFDGAVDYIDMEDALDLNPTGFTISAWIKRDAADSGTKSILSKRDTGFTQGYELRILNTNRIQFLWKNGSDQLLHSPTVIPDDEWHHVAVIYNGSRVFIYIDGVLSNFEDRTPPVDTDESFYIAAAGKNSPVQHFRGNIDEVRVWNTDLTVDQLRFVMNQEIEDNTAFVAGKVLPTTITKNDVGNIPWSDLAGYYPMSVYTYTNTEDASGNGNQGALRNLNTVDRQTAPLPYESRADGDWTTDETWLNYTVQTMPNALSIVDNTTPIDWNIVRVNHNVKIDTENVLGRDRQVLGMYVESSAELTVDGNNFDDTAGNGLTVSHYLKLDGKIDLEGQSQLVQGIDSDLDPTSIGTLEKDQQGTADVYTYNYWSSPVGETSPINNNNPFSVTDVMYDDVNPINFSNSGYDGSDGATITIADYWIWKFANQPDDDYSAWQHIRQSGTINIGEGFTMKGPGSGGVVDQQNYVFLGKPNNGDINLTLNAGNDYLVGNPYPSAIDANIFITDNGPNITGAGANPLISGTLYFWEHWGGGSHILSEYQGGYATYNFSGGVGAPSLGTNDPDVATGGTPTKVPGRYIPVSQGFFVVGESTGNINFNNGQRIYRKESPGTSVFVREDLSVTTASYDETQNTDERMKFRIGFNSVNTIHRQLLLTIDENTSTGYDWAYDAKTYDYQMDDLFWMIDNEKYIIQGSNEAEPESVYPLGISTSDDGMNTITIDQLENVPDNVEIYIHDLDNDMYHNLRESDFEFHLPAGEYLDRFELTFMENSDTLSTTDTQIKTVDVFYDNETQSIVLLNPNFVDVKSIEMFNIIGQNITKIENISELDYSEYEVKNLSTGAYIIQIDTLSGLISKKVLVK